jgi:ECF transporter S component (folate family)
MKFKVSVRELCQIAMLIALTFVLERLVPVLSIQTSRITFAFIPMMACGMFFGPIWGAVAFGAADILGWPIMGLTPIPLILLSRIVNGFLFGLILYREKLTFWPHSVLSAFATQILCGAGLTTLGLALAFGNPYIPLLISRIPQFLIFIVLQIAVFPGLVRLRDILSKTGLLQNA